MSEPKRYLPEDPFTQLLEDLEEERDRLRRRLYNLGALLPNRGKRDFDDMEEIQRQVDGLTEIIVRHKEKSSA